MDPEELRREDLTRWRRQFPDTTPIGAARPRHPGTFVGVVAAIRLVPGRSLDVLIEDGTGRVALSWSARSQLPGLELGAGLRATGTVAVDDGLSLIRNPDWAFVAPPYA